MQRANVLAVERQAEAARQQSAAKAESERRRELHNAAGQSLENILSLLHQLITANAPAAQISSGSALGTWSLNNATMRVEHPKSASPQSDELIPRMPFEVILYTTISLAGPSDRTGYTGRSHSLWYCDAQESGVFRWYETAFMKTFGGDNRIAPFAMPPGGQDAALALSPALHTHQVAWPFMPTDQGDEESFTERWMGWFGEAAQGLLRYPSRMPELETSGSWRQGH